MKNQHGSVLVGVIGFSVILAMGATGYIMTSGRAHESEQSELDLARLYGAAEGAMAMTADYTTNEWPLTTMNTSAGWTTYPNEHGTPNTSWKSFDGAYVRSSHYKPHADTMQLRTWATLPNRIDTLLLIWNVTFDDTYDPTGKTKKSKIKAVTLWKDSLIYH